VTLRVRTRPALLLTRGLLLTIAAACLGDFAYRQVSQSLYQAEAARAFDREAENPVPFAARQASRSPTLPLGKLSIPRLDWSAIVDEGDDDATLERAVGHVPTTATPDDGGNVVLAGHRDTFFRALKDLHVNDEIDFRTAAGRYHYQVASLRVVSPDFLEVLRPSTQDQLTLITCYPFDYIGSAPRRFIVEAHRVDR